MKRRSRLLHPICQPYFCAVSDCLLAILLKFIDNTGTVQLRPPLVRMNRDGCRTCGWVFVRPL
jgi:hypothetical protein